MTEVLALPKWCINRRLLTNFIAIFPSHLLSFSISTSNNLQQSTAETNKSQCRYFSLFYSMNQTNRTFWQTKENYKTFFLDCLARSFVLCRFPGHIINFLSSVCDQNTPHSFNFIFFSGPLLLFFLYFHLPICTFKHTHVPIISENNNQFT